MHFVITRTVKSIITANNKKQELFTNSGHLNIKVFTPSANTLRHIVCISLHQPSRQNFENRQQNAYSHVHHHGVQSEKFSFFFISFTHWHNLTHRKRPAVQVNLAKVMNAKVSKLVAQLFFILNREGCHNSVKFT